MFLSVSMITVCSAQDQSKHSIRLTSYRDVLARLSLDWKRAKDPLHVVWLFDESPSMKDDQQEIRKLFGKVFEELAMLPEPAGDADSRMLTSMFGFSDRIHQMTRQPTAKLSEIRKAIDRLPVATNGEEATCLAVVRTRRRRRTYHRIR
ncbi:MAG: hypothetical protein CMJ78_10040 [Planctomycetaceae bacterium]|nr:hypothetical protein [Planctomycetaceae bacterium]